MNWCHYSWDLFSTCIMPIVLHVSQYMPCVALCDLILGTSELFSTWKGDCGSSQASKKRESDTWSSVVPIDMGFVGISCPIYKELCASYEMVWFRALNFSLSNPVSLLLFPEGAVLPGQELPSMTKAPSGFAMVFSVRIERGASLGKNSQASNLLQIYDLGQII